MNLRLYVGNLAFSTEEQSIEGLFAEAGPVQSVNLMRDRATGQSRGFAFVEYADRDTAEAAIRQFDGQLFMGRPLAVSEARAREDRGPGGPPRPGGGFGGPRPAGGGAEEARVHRRQEGRRLALPRTAAPQGRGYGLMFRTRLISVYEAGLTGRARHP